MNANLAAEIRHTLKLASPIMFAQLLIVSMTFVDNLMVGRLGKIELGGLALAVGFYNMVTIVVIGLLSAVSPLISERVGADNPVGAGMFARQGVVLSIVVTAALLPLLWWSEPLLIAVGQQPTTSAIAASYLHAMIWAMPLNLAFIACRIFAEATDDSMPSLILAAFLALLNIPLDYALIHGVWFAPKLGVAGAGYATAILYAVGLLSLLSYFATRKRYAQFQFFNGSWVPDFTLWRDVLRVGVPLSGAIATEMGFFVTATFLMGRIGEVELAAHQVAINASAMMFMFPLGLSFAVGIRISACLGRDDIDGARTAWIASLIITGAIALMGMTLFLVVPESIVALYDQKDEVKTLATRLLMISGLFQLFDGFQVVGMGALRGLKDGKFAFRATTTSFWVFGIAVVLYFYANNNPIGIWIGLLVGLAAASLIHHTKVNRMLRR